MSSIYSPEDDSYLLSETLKEYLPKKIQQNKEFSLLEIGIGSGIQLQTALSCGLKSENLSGVDINEDAIILCKNLGFNCFVSDLFSKVKGKFDLIIFNPPYLPEDESEPKDSRLITTGGKFGSELINDFLSQAKNHLNSNGKIFLLVSSLTKKIKWENYKKKLISKKKIFFEELKVYELSL